jgi:hypothetical protein
MLLHPVYFFHPVWYSNVEAGFASVSGQMAYTAVSLAKNDRRF